jgi:hypothetical protein
MSENQRVPTEQERRWLEENRDAIASINAFIERHGLCADRLRYREAHQDQHALVIARESGRSSTP